MFDCIIKNGRICDGTGSPWYRGDLAIAGDQIAVISKIPLHYSAKQIIDAQSMIVAPGFIDFHSHADLAALREPDCLGRLRQGVTTQVVGNCGLSVAPVNQIAKELLPSFYDATLGSYPGEWSWSGVGEYLDFLAEQKVGTNIAVLMGHATFRTSVMKGIQNRQPTAEEYRVLQSLIERGLEEGAFGISTGLIYPPSCYADSEELTKIAAMTQKGGGIYTSHIRSEGRNLIPAVKEVVQIAERTGIPCHISHLKANNPTCWGQVIDVLQILDQSRRHGLDLSCDLYPYVAGSGALSSITPSWVQEGGTAAMIERLKDGTVRKKIREQFELNDVPGWDNYVKSVGWENIIISWVKTDRHKELEGQSVAQIVQEYERDPWDVVADLLIEENGAVQMVAFIMSENDIQTVMRYPGTMFGSDGIESGGKPHPRLFGTFPRILERYVRTLKVLTLEDAIRKMTSLPAARLGLHDRGVIKAGMKADLVIFDPESIEERATYIDPYRHPAGIEYVLVNGRVSLARSKPQAGRFGQVLRNQNP